MSDKKRPLAVTTSPPVRGASLRSPSTPRSPRSPHAVSAQPSHPPRPRTASKPIQPAVLPQSPIDGGSSSNSNSSGSSSAGSEKHDLSLTSDPEHEAPPKLVEICQLLAEDLHGVKQEIKEMKDEMKGHLRIIESLRDQIISMFFEQIYFLQVSLHIQKLHVGIDQKDMYQAYMSHLMSAQECFMENSKGVRTIESMYPFCAEYVQNLKIRHQQQPQQQPLVPRPVSPPLE